MQMSQCALGGVLLVIVVCRVEGLWFEDVMQLANETRPVVFPVRRYCDGNATMSEPLLYETPSCSASNVQTPLHNSVRATPLEFYQLKGLSFCCKSNYTAALPRGTNITAKDEEARYLYQQAVENALRRYDCSTFYPFHSCAPCAYAYRSWVCATVFPLACRVVSSPSSAVSVAQRMPMCRDVCFEVARKCPYTFNFRCPLTTEYGNPTVPDAFSNLSGLASWGCNPMERLTIVSSSSGSCVAARISLVVFAVLLLLAL